MAAYDRTLSDDTEDLAAASFLVGCSRLLPMLIRYEDRLPRWDRGDPGATAPFVVCNPPPCHPDALPLLSCTPCL